MAFPSKVEATPKLVSDKIVELRRTPRDGEEGPGKGEGPVRHSVDTRFLQAFSKIKSGPTQQLFLSTDQWSAGDDGSGGTEAHSSHSGGTRVMVGIVGAVLIATAFLNPALVPAIKLAIGALGALLALVAAFSR